METFHWTYKEYCETTEFIIRLIAEKNEIDIKFNKIKDVN